MVQVQLRLSDGTVKHIDEWVREGRFKSRSEAIKVIINFYEERERTRDFLSLLMARSKEAEEHPENFVPLEELGWDIK